MSVSKLKTSNSVVVRRTNGVLESAYLQGRTQDGDVIIAWNENGIVVGKVVSLKQFVELNPTYKHLLPVITFELSPEQIKAIQECRDCPNFIKNIPNDD